MSEATRGIIFGSPEAEDLLADSPPELIPCPWCSGTNFAVIDKRDKGWKAKLLSVQIECSGCGARGPKVRPGKDQAMVNYWELAAPAWNEIGKNDTGRVRHQNSTD